MKVLEVDSPSAKEHPLIKEFVGLVDETVGDGILDFTDLQEPPFLKFWAHFIIYNYEEPIGDFRVVLFGTHVAVFYGMDGTGKLLSEIGLGEAHDEIHNLTLRVMKGDRRVYSNGTLYWQNNEHRVWNQVKMPLQRSGRVNEVLTCMHYS